MSKAFTRESDDAPEEIPAIPRTPLPPGVKNYITPDGAKRLAQEKAALLEQRRAGAEALPAARLDARLRWIEEVLQSAVVAEPPASDPDCVRFGAFVRVLRGSEEESYRIVGTDETDIDRGWISWLSPLARALLGQRRGGNIAFQSPAGPQQIEIMEVHYGAAGEAGPEAE